MENDIIQLDEIEQIKGILDSVIIKKNDYNLIFLETKIKELENLFLDKRNTFTEGTPEWHVYNIYSIRINDTKERELLSAKTANSRKYIKGKISQNRVNEFEFSFEKVITQLEQDLLMLIVRYKESQQSNKS